jgi:hypothetical protein
MSRKPILALDFDGVLHSYRSGWQGAAIIPDPPVTGAVEFLHAAVERFRVAVYSSRSAEPGGIDAMRGWLTMHVMAVIDDHREAQHVLDLIEWPVSKPSAFVTLDDRAITFNGTWPGLDELAAFQPWMKRTPAGELPRVRDREIRAAEETKLVRPLDPAAAFRAAEKANRQFGQFMPRRWLDMFIQAYREEAGRG